MHRQTYRPRSTEWLALMLIVSLVTMPGLTASQAAAYNTVKRAAAAQSELPNVPESQGPTTEAPALAVYGNLPLVFEANEGQTDSRVKFITRAGGATIFLTPSDAVFALRKSHCGTRNELSESRPDGTVAGGPIDSHLQDTNCNSQTATLSMKIEGANAATQVEGIEKLPGIVNYFVGNDPAQWHANIPTYARVRYTGIYEGIDLEYYGVESQQLEYDFVVKPGADAAQVSLSFEGADSMVVDSATGDLLIETSVGEVRQHKPVVYQNLNEERLEIPSGYQLKQGNRVGFTLGAYDRSEPLVIDPTLVYSTYLGGNNTDLGYGIAVDSVGNAYVSGSTGSNNFPTTFPIQAAKNGNVDAFVTKLNPKGTALLYSTYIGGSGNDSSYRIATDSSGNAYVTGATNSTNFPAVNPVQAANGSGPNDAFVIKLNPSGSTLFYSTYLGGSGADAAFGIAADSSGNAYVTGNTNSTDFPTVTPIQAANGGGLGDAFVTKLNPAGSAMLYSTYLGGNGVEAGDAITVDSTGNVFVVGETESTNFPTLSPIQPANAGVRDAFVTKLNAGGSALLYSTYLGGSGLDNGYGIAIDSSGNAYVAGQTASTNFPTFNPFQPANAGGPDDGFVAKLTPTGSALAYSTYLGGAGDDGFNSITVDSSGKACVTGQSSSINFPTANPIQAANGGSYDAVVTTLNAAGSALVFSTYLGGNTQDLGNSVAVDLSGNVYVTGLTEALNFPTANPLQPSNAGGDDGFVTKIAPGKIFTVNVTGDGQDANIGDGNCQTSTPGNCSLRAAIQEAEADAGKDTINFNISGGGFKTITPGSALPQINDAVIIDGYSQPGTQTNLLANNDNAVILIELNGSNAGANSSGLVITAGSSVVQGLAINSFGANGIELDSRGINLVRGNLIGLDPLGTTALGNGIFGVFVSSNDNTIGGSSVSSRNVIAGNGKSPNDDNQAGIDVFHCSGNIVLGNFIGTDRSGAVQAHNFKGVRIFGGINSTIGGTTSGARNIISGNNQAGIEIVGQAATGNQVLGNYIGTDVNGTAAIDNNTGILISDSPLNVIGGATVGARNVISGNRFVGIEITNAGANRNQVQGNFIGVRADGTAALSNTTDGIVLLSSSNTLIGGTAAGSGNVISGNGSFGLRILGSNFTQVLGNFIGTDSSGTNAMGNSKGGIAIGAASINSVIGGPGTGERNIISANGNTGVSITDSGTTGNLVWGNYIGTAADGLTALGNASYGIALAGDATNNRIGGPVGSGNVIAFNLEGIATNSANTTGNLMLSNLIFSNHLLGIDLDADGVSPNDVGDFDFGGNNLQNFPVISSAVTDGTSTTLNGSLDGEVNTSFTIQFFANSSCDSSGYGEGQTYVGSINRTTGADGHLMFSTSTLTNVAAGSFITATATDSSNNTSEFSQCVQVMGSAPTPAGIQLSSSSYSVGEGDLRANITIIRTGNTSGATTVGYATSDLAGIQPCDVFNGIASPRCDYTVSIGTVEFEPGETSKSFSIPIVDDSYAEGNETFNVSLNSSGGTLKTPFTATVTINDNDMTTGPNPLAGTNFFVRQHYLDFLGREPDPVGYAGWVNALTSCAAGDTTCDRVHVSEMFFRSDEFQQRGYFIYRFYPVSFGRKPNYAEFVPDFARVSGFLTDAQLETAKVAFIADFMARPAFTATYNSLTNQQYVDTLLVMAGVTISNRQALIDGLNNNTLTRAQVLRQIVESSEVAQKYSNQAFVVMEYFGYLRRDPDALYLIWVDTLNGGASSRIMISGFVSSIEYYQRFGPP